MLTVKRKGENRLDIYVAGKLESAAMKAALDDLVARSEGIEHGRMFYRIEDFAMPSLGAIAVELARLPQLFSFIRRFDRAAVVADKQWVRKISELEGTLIPGLTIRAFSPEEEAQAEVWLEE